MLGPAAPLAMFRDEKQIRLLIEFPLCVCNMHVCVCVGGVMCISGNSHIPHRSETVKIGWISHYSVCRPDTVDSPAHSGQGVVQGALGELL